MPTPKTNKTSIWKTRFLLVLVCTFIVAASAQSQNYHDKVYLRNGDILTGEIKNLNLALLSFKMPGPGTISIKWEEVANLISNRIYIIKFRTGMIVTARIDSGFYKKYSVIMDDLIEIDPSGKTFIKGLFGNVNMGINYTKSSANFQYNLAASVSYKLPKWEFNTSASFNTTSKYGDSSLSKVDAITLDALLFLPKYYFVFSQIGWQKNTELGLANRFIYNGGVGNTLILNNHNRLRAAGGVSLNLEESVDNPVYAGNFDLLALIDYKLFYNSFPKKTIDAAYYLFPSISDWGRLRMQFNLSGKIEVVKDFLVGLVFYYNYDSKPLEGASSNYDYGLNFTLSYQFGK